jgi:hypothetical protein
MQLKSEIVQQSKNCIKYLNKQLMIWNCWAIKEFYTINIQLIICNGLAIRLNIHTADYLEWFDHKSFTKYKYN